MTIKRRKKKTFSKEKLKTAMLEMGTKMINHQSLNASDTIDTFLNNPGMYQFIGEERYELLRLASRFLYDFSDQLDEIEQEIK